MAWNPNPKVAMCREVARLYDKQMVVLLMVDTKANTLEYASYGETKTLCGEARKMADAAYDAVMEHVASGGEGLRNPLREALEIVMNFPGVDSYITAVCHDALHPEACGGRCGEPDCNRTVDVREFPNDQAHRLPPAATVERKGKHERIQND